MIIMYADAPGVCAKDHIMEVYENPGMKHDRGEHLNLGFLGGESGEI
jgi:hypothetical protein